MIEYFTNDCQATLEAAMGCFTFLLPSSHIWILKRNNYLAVISPHVTSIASNISQSPLNCISIWNKTPFMNQEELIINIIYNYFIFKCNCGYSFKMKKQKRRNDSETIFSIVISCGDVCYCCSFVSFTLNLK